MINQKKILVVISGRGGSKEVPKKNIRDLGGIPLIAHMFKKAKSIANIDKVICSTDNEQIANIAREYNVDVPFMRPLELAGDRTPLISVTQHALRKMDDLGFNCDIVVQLAPTCPFVKVSNIKKSIELISSDCDCAVSLKKIEHEHPYRARELKADNFFENYIKNIDVEDRKFHSRQDLPTLFCTSGALYTRKRKLLDDFDGSDFAMGKKRKGIIFDEFESVNIDRMIDFRFSQFLIKEGLITREHLL